MLPADLSFVSLLMKAKGVVEYMTSSWHSLLKESMLAL